MSNITVKSAYALLNAITQETRLLKLTTSVDNATLVAECARGEEGISCSFRFLISALSPDANLSLKSLIGQPVLLELLTDTRGQPRSFHGHVTGAQANGANGGLARYQLVVEPWYAFLAHGRDSRIFQDKTIFEILEIVFGTWQDKGRLIPAWRFDIFDFDGYPKRSLTTQYQESDFAFIERLMNEEGLFHYFDHTGDPASPALGSHVMVIADHNGSFKPNRQPIVEFSQSSAVMKQDTLDRWRTEFHAQTNMVELRSWDYRTRSSRPVTAATGEGAGGIASLVVREYAGAYAYETTAQGQRRADRMMEAIAARKEVHTAAGTVRTLAPGTTFTIRGHALHDLHDDDSGRNFIVTRTVHLMHNNLSAELRAEISRRLEPSALSALIKKEETHSLHAVGTGKGERPLYRVRIDAIRSSIAYRSAKFDEHGSLLFPRPTVIGQQTAIVVGPVGSVIHTDRDHRVKVQFHWQRGKQSHSRLIHPSDEGHSGAPADDSAGTWIRLATPMAPLAGANWGSNALPRVGQEVLVDFIDGDIDRPVVIGSLYNGKGGKDAQNNDLNMGAGVATGNAPAWFAGEDGGHAHPATLSGYKTQSIFASQTGTGPYNQLVFDDSPGQARLALQRHAAAHRGTDELNLGQLRHQTDNQRLAPAGFGLELKSEHSLAFRAARGLLLSSDRRNGAIGAQLDSSEAHAQVATSLELQTAMGTAAQKHNAALRDEGQRDEAAPENQPALEQMSQSVKVLGSTSGGMGKGGAGGAGPSTAYSDPHLQISAASGIAALTPQAVVFCSGNTSSVTAGHDISVLAQGNCYHAVAAGISLFTLGKANSPEKPNQEAGIKLHAASGKVCSASQSDATNVTAAKSIAVVSVTKGVHVTAATHVMFTAQGAFFKLEGGNIMVHGPGKIEFKAGSKELTGPASATAVVPPSPVGKLSKCPTK